MASYSPPIYPPTLPGGDDEHEDGDATPPKSGDAQKLETKPQATFLTKLYALLERPEYQSMIRWDAAGEQIIVERPEQLALHVLPSIYRQSRFASFSRQLNIYGFMRKVNLRNVDPAIDDPDASTWSHPTLNRNSPPEVVANFKRRVPPRLPKPRKRDQLDMGRVGPGSLAPGLTVPSSTHMLMQGKPRTRGFSAPSLPFGFAGTAHLQPAGQPSYYNVAPPQKWGGGASYGTSLPPLTVPEHNYPYRHDDHYYHPQQLPVLRDSAALQYPGYGTGAPGSGADTSSWSFLPPASSLTSSHSSLSSLLNPATSYRPGSSGFAHGSPDSRPNTGYSVASSVSSIGYDANDQNPFALRPTTRDDPARPLTPTSAGGVRPASSKASSLTIRNGRPRRHSQVSPYPSPYDSEAHSRPGTAEDPRARSIADSYPSFHGPAPAEFAYSASGPPVETAEWMGRVRPGTSTSTMSGHSPASNSALNTPPGIDDAAIATTPPASAHGPSGPFGASEQDMSRCEYSFWLHFTMPVCGRLFRNTALLMSSSLQLTCSFEQSVSSDLGFFGMTDGPKPPIHA
ncbi:Heat shock factor protein 1 [Ceratobasidium theobromae]|uniref:Heat shock factor protein 1 n=1 Tax=Ceratobasidium theobromae TaxID=1582974 RepID=A0A5N5QRQ6_9AGAM|nr:Heat shock factor protein 1 [Ceratobasidium theobromae]